jgi:hypothetical protein
MPGWNASEFDGDPTQLQSDGSPNTQGRTHGASATCGLDGRHARAAAARSHTLDLLRALRRPPPLPSGRLPRQFEDQVASSTGEGDFALRESRLHLLAREQSARPRGSSGLAAIVSAIALFAAVPLLDRVRSLGLHDTALLLGTLAAAILASRWRLAGASAGEAPASC